jgi:predicted ATPase
MLHQFRGEHEAAEKLAEESASLCREFDFQYYLSWAPIIQGWAHTRRGAAEDGLGQMRAGLDALRATGAALRAPYYLGLMAEACGRLGRLEEGLGHLAEAFALGQQSRESWVKPELHRIRGDLQLQLGQPGESAASYQEAYRLARQQGSWSFALRAACALARRFGGVEQLREVYARFDPASDSPDMLDARALLAGGAVRGRTRRSAAGSAG